MNDKVVSKKKSFKLPHVYILLMSVMVLAVILSWIIPSGEFGRVLDPASGRMIVDPSNFQYVDTAKSITIIDFFSAIHKGIVESGDIIVMLLIAIGSITLVEKSGAIDAGIHRLLEVTKGKDILVMTLLTLIFALLGTIGFAEGGIPFIPLAIKVLLALGYDKITGLAIAQLGLALGFSSGIFNLSTTGVSQSILGLPVFSGYGFRALAFALFYIVAMIYIINYAKKIKKDHSKSIVAEQYASQSFEDVEKVSVEFTLRRKLSLIALALVFIIQAYGAIQLKWGLAQISGLYLMFAVVLVIILNLNPSKACVEFAKGASTLLPAAIAIGIARSVMILMSQAKIIDTAIYKLAESLQGKSPIVILFAVYLSVIIFNFFVTSGSGKAVILMPILGPLGQLVGVNQQIMVLMYNFGDGFTNYLWPTSGVLMGALEMCDVEWQEWIKFSGKIITLLATIGFVLIALAHYVDLGPF